MFPGEDLRLITLWVRFTASDPPGGFLDAREYAGLDCFSVTFDSPNYVYLDEITVEVTGEGKPSDLACGRHCFLLMTNKTLTAMSTSVPGSGTSDVIWPISASPSGSNSRLKKVESTAPRSGGVKGKESLAKIIPVESPKRSDKKDLSLRTPVRTPKTATA